MYASVRKTLKEALLWSEQYARTDMLYLFKAGFWTSLGFASSSLLSLVLVVAFANFIPKETYGTYKYILSVSGMLGFLTLTGMNTAVSQMVARGHEGILPYAVKVQLRFNVLFLLGSAIAAAYYSLQGNTTLAQSLLILGVTFPIATALNTYGAYLVGKERFKAANAYGTISGAIYIAAMMVALLLTDDVLVLVAVYGLASLLPTAFIYWRVSRKVHGTATDEDKRALVRFSGHLSLMNVLSTINAYIDNILVFHYIGAVELAAYGLADAIPSRLKGYMKSLVGTSFPRLSQKSLGEIQESLLLRAGQTTLAGAVATAAYWFIAPPLFAIFFPDYSESVHISQVIMLNFVLLPLNTYTAFVMQAQRLVKYTYISSVSVNCIRLVLYLVFAHLYGLWGVVWALIISNSFSVFLNLVLISRAKESDKDSITPAPEPRSPQQTSTAIAV